MPTHTHVSYTPQPKSINNITKPISLSALRVYADKSKINRHIQFSITLCDRKQPSGGVQTCNTGAFITEQRLYLMCTPPLDPKQTIHHILYNVLFSI